VPVIRKVSSFLSAEIIRAEEMKYFENYHLSVKLFNFFLSCAFNVYLVYKDNKN